MTSQYGSGAYSIRSAWPGSAPARPLWLPWRDASSRLTSSHDINAALAKHAEGASAVELSQEQQQAPSVCSEVKCGRGT